MNRLLLLFLPFLFAGASFGESRTSVSSRASVARQLPSKARILPRPTPPRRVPPSPVPLPRPRPLPLPLPNGGLEASLAPSGYQFTQVADPTNTFSLPAVRTVLRATASVFNRGRVNVPFGFSDRSILTRSWNFRLYDATGVMVWQSEAEGEGTPDAQPFTFNLPPGRSISRTLVIPLRGDNGPFAPGRYTLEAVLLSDVPLVVTSLISIVPPTNRPPVNPLLGTVNGLVVFPDRDPETGQMRPAGGMRVSISPNPNDTPLPEPPDGGSSPPSPGLPGVSNSADALPPGTPNVFWSGITREDGTFSARLRPGNYVVHVQPAVMIMIYPPPPMPTGRAEITITANETTETTIVLSMPQDPRVPGPGDPNLPVTNE